jgi:molybdate transport system substrate-binding protein
MPKAALLALAISICPRFAVAEASGKELVVFAAASLREVFEGLAPGFEKTHPNTKVRLNLAGSQELRTQIEQGARADVFASADWKHLTQLEKAGLVDKALVFARNQPVIVVPKGNTLGIKGVADLTKAKRLVVGAPEVPIGSYTVKILDAAAKKHGAHLRTKIEANVVSRELNVRQVLAKVTLGEADAGIVYRTDAQASRDKVDLVAIAPELNVIAEYPIAVVKAAGNASLARAWVDLVTGAEGQSRLAQAGFQTGPAQGAAMPAATQVPAR